MADMSLERAYPGLFDHREANCLHALQGKPEAHGPRARIVECGQAQTRSLYLCRGFVGRTRMDRSGKRQFLALQIAGDFIDLQAFVLERLDHDIHAIGEVVVRPSPHASLRQLSATDSELMQKLWRVSLIDAAIHRYWIFRLGRLSGRARLANFFSEMLVRLYARGLGTLTRYHLPLTQTDIAEICGMTPVHANRLIGELRAEGTCDFLNGEVLVSDPAQLLRAGQFSWDYLFLHASLDEELRRLLKPQKARA